MNAMYALVLVCGQCSGGQCGRQYVQPAPTMQATQNYEWRVNEHGNAELFRGGVAVGLYENGRYFPWDGAKFNAPYPPADAQALADRHHIRNYGVVTERIHDNDPGGFSDASGVPDDLGKYRVTVRTDDTTLRKAIDAAFAPYKDKLLMQTYPPGHWALNTGLDYGLIHVQGPPRADGKAPVVHSQADFADGAAGVATALRKIDPSFDATTVVDQRKNVSPTDDLLKWLQSPSPVGGLAWWIVLSVGGFLAYKFKDKWMPAKADQAAVIAEVKRKRGLK